MTPPEPQDINTYLANEWFKQGFEYSQLGQYEQAIASWDIALETKPDSYQVWIYRGMVLCDHLQRYEEALTSFDKALKIKPDRYEVWHNQGEALFHLRQFEQAIASYDQALQIQPNNHKAWYSRGSALYHLGRFEEAITSYDQALQIQPDEYKAWYSRGSALSHLGRFEEAIACFDQAIEIKPDDHQAWYNRGSALSDIGRFEEAISSFDPALQIQSNNHNVWYSRGIALYHLGRFEEAIASYDQALQIQSDDYQAWTNRGSALSHLWRFEEAIASYDKALQIQPDDHLSWFDRGMAAVSSPKYKPQVAAILQEQFPSSPPVMPDPTLTRRGYEGELLCYREGLKHCLQSTHPEGWGRLHQATGNAHYFQGRVDSNYRYFWCKSINSYDQALITLTEENFPELHLEVLRDYIKPLLGLGQTAEAEELLRRGTDLLRRLLSEPNRSDWSKKQLSLKFVGFSQLTVDLLVQSGQLVQALEVAEEGKNACLTWLLYAWNDEILNPNWEDIKQLVNPTTAVVYWHLSPVALTTFIFKHDASEPTVITTSTPKNPIEAIHELPIPESVQRLQEFENWVKEWNRQYMDYRSKAKDTQNRSNHSWRVGMEKRLKHLKKILNIPAIEQKLKDITQVILIPHRDLHRFPIHALFSENTDFTITYLPSTQIGINLQQRQPNPTNHLLSVEHPTNQVLTSLQFAQFESEAISQMFDKPKRVQSEDATKNQVEEALSSEYSIFHFTGHGTYNFNNPKKSELALADEDKLTLEEITQKNLSHYNLVTLSACETAITGNQTITTEYVGLVSGFLSQGVAHVVSTLWTVESAATALVMIEFYRRRQAGKSEAVALAEATQWLRHLTVQQLKEWYEAFLSKLPPNELRISAFVETEVYRLGRMEPDRKLYDRPYYWAAFTITGKPC